MTQSIQLEVTHSDREPGLIDGFKFIWAYYVNGFNPRAHCQACFKGKRVDDFRTGTASAGRTVVLDQIEHYKYAYICGVGIGPDAERRTQNFHLPLRYQENASVTKPTYNGYIVTAPERCGAPDPCVAGWLERGRSQDHAL